MSPLVRGPVAPKRSVGGSPVTARRFDSKRDVFITSKSQAAFPSRAYYAANPARETPNVPGVACTAAVCEAAGESPAGNAVEIACREEMKMLSGTMAAESP